MAWFDKIDAPKVKDDDKKASVPTGLFKKCSGCQTASLSEDVERALMTCPECGHHFRVRARARLAMTFDQGTYVELAKDLVAEDPLSFSDARPYPERLKASQEKSGEQDAFVLGRGGVLGRNAIIGVFEFSFMGGSMGSVVGEKVARAFEAGLEASEPVIIFSASGGARMQEGILSLMQMAKTSAAIGRYRDAGLPYISVLTDPTTGGVAASFALLGDIILAEPGALVGFAGPRVIEQTIRQKLPEGAQRSEFLLDRGMVDRVVPRTELREQLGQLIDFLGHAAR